MDPNNVTIQNPLHVTIGTLGFSNRSESDDISGISNWGRSFKYHIFSRFFFPALIDFKAMSG